MKEDPDFSMKTDLGDSKYTEQYFYNRGGHRCWMSPEAAPRVTYPDNHPVSYVQMGNTVVVTQPPQEGNEVELSFEITMSDIKDEIEINHVIKNTGFWGKQFAVWPITVVAENGTEYIPQNTVNKGLLPNRNLVLWSYAKINDTRLSLGDKYISLRQDPSVESAFKLGLSQERPWAAYFHHGDMFVKKYTPVKGASYPDYGCTYETYTNGQILEMETLGELKTVEPGETNAHKEIWLLFKDVPLPANESEMDGVAVKYNLEQER